MLELSVNAPEAVAESVRILRQPGAVLLVPTETVYGLVCRFDDAEAAAEIYRLKGRDRGKPLTLFIRGINDIAAAGGVPDDRARRLMAKFMPGPITLILPGADGGPAAGVRMPDHPFMLKLLKELPWPLASTSANASGAPDARSCGEALAMLNGSPAAAVDAGPLPEGAAASTIVDLRGAETGIIRHGPITDEAVFAALGRKL